MNKSQCNVFCNEMFNFTVKPVYLGVILKSLQTILASGVTLSLFAASAVIKTSAAAPSFSVLALAAVTVPNGRLS